MRDIVALNQNTQFKKLYSKGKSNVQSALVMYVKKNGLGFNRLGITVSKKVGKAVQRNRAKRRLREVYRLNYLNLQKGYDIVLVARVRTVNAPFEQIRKAFIDSSKKLGILE